MADTTKRYPSRGERAYEARREAGFATDPRGTVEQPVKVYAPFATKDNDTSAYVGVSPEYMTYADDTQKPLRAQGGVEGKLEEAVFAGAPAVRIATATPENTATQGDGASDESVYTANSGEGFTPKVVTDDGKPAVNSDAEAVKGGEPTGPAETTDSKSTKKTAAPVKPSTPDAPAS